MSIASPWQKGSRGGAASPRGARSRTNVAREPRVEPEGEAHGPRPLRRPPPSSTPGGGAVPASVHFPSCRPQ
eukprot:6921371-Pyramimonas_sp.AAC.1